MILEVDLKRLVGWGIEKNGCYSDRDQFMIVPLNKARTEWALWSADEVSHDNDEFICNLIDFDNLKYLYWTLAYNELEILDDYEK